MASTVRVFSITGCHGAAHIVFAPRLVSAKHDSPSLVEKASSTTANCHTNASIWLVVQFPARIQTTFGGLPYRTLR